MADNLDLCFPYFKDGDLHKVKNDLVDVKFKLKKPSSIRRWLSNLGTRLFCLVPNNVVQFPTLLSSYRLCCTPTFLLKDNKVGNFFSP